MCRKQWQVSLRPPGRKTRRMAPASTDEREWRTILSSDTSASKAAKPGAWPRCMSGRSWPHFDLRAMFGFSGSKMPAPAVPCGLLILAVSDQML